MKIVILGLSITSSWGNGHATTYRGLVRELAANGHDILFLERDVEWYASNRDLPSPPYCETRLYDTREALHEHEDEIRDADLVILGSYVADGVAIGDWVTGLARGVVAFYDIDTPVTLAKLANGDFEYLAPRLIPRFDLYLSFTGGPTLRRIEQQYGAPRARALYCSFDPEHYFPMPGQRVRWDLGYLGTYSDDRQPALERLLLEPARQSRERRFIVAGPQYPAAIAWPANVERQEHLPPKEHRAFYNSQRFTLNVTRAAMIEAGWSPSVRLFEAAACGVPLISDWWEGLGELFEPDREILIAGDARDVMRYLNNVDEQTRRAIGLRARDRVLAEHTGADRARQLETYVNEVTSAVQLDRDAVTA